jgi:hypothetical protein
MSAGFRVGATVGANVTAVIVLMYTGLITGFMAELSAGHGAGFRSTSVLSYCSAATHLVYGIVLFWYRDHAMPDGAADSSASGRGGDSEPILPTASPAPPAVASFSPPAPAQPKYAPVADSGSNPWV